MHTDFTATQMYWQPSLIRLTQMPDPEMDEGRPTVCYISPDKILAIHRIRTAFSKAGQNGPQEYREYHPHVVCTCVVTGYYNLMVTELPEQIAILRDQAMGHSKPPAPVVPLK